MQLWPLNYNKESSLFMWKEWNIIKCENSVSADIVGTIAVEMQKPCCGVADDKCCIIKLSEVERAIPAQSPNHHKQNN